MSYARCSFSSVFLCCHIVLSCIVCGLSGCQCLGVLIFLLTACSSGSLSVWVFVALFVYLSVCLSVCLSVRASARPSICPSVPRSVCLYLLLISISVPLGLSRPSNPRGRRPCNFGVTLELFEFFSMPHLFLLP